VGKFTKPTILIQKFTSATAFTRFDVVLDCTGRSEGFNLNLLKSWANAKYVTLSPPTLNNFDNNGLLGGILKTGMDLMSNNTSALMEGKTMRWGFFMPNPCALKKMSSLANDSKVRTSSY